MTRRSSESHTEPFALPRQSSDRIAGGGRSWVRRFIAGAVVMAVLIGGGTAFRVWQVARMDDRAQADAIVVLGAAQYNGRPSPIFKARLVHAKNLFDEGVAPRVITSGGNQAGDNYTEAEAGKRWLIEQGVPESAAVPVNEGADTLGSLTAVAQQAESNAWQSVVIVSDPWHTQRAQTMAHDLGLDAWGSPTHSGPIVQTRERQAKYIYRETGALLYYRLSRTPADDIGGTGLG